ncbi:oxidoreductase [Sphingobium sp. SCG-1]|uniref:Gfo/Idh/MocA family protein n=1 Tax=Sphingobium sp. SCG-1 TaxID=2072936 RepID=UPI000CD6A727|nr:Gfo/Idh/MocA family oxidoreductase [Sphingobium sp. SCG-1]AUW57289.1 oxidoreductase [Sphingobium sp. SCG-1]
MNELLAMEAEGELDGKIGRPRIGFLGVGWIGRHRMQAMIDSGLATAAAVADLSPDNLREALQVAPGATEAESLDALLDMDLDGIVIATPSALHAAQSIEALDRGIAVFCQKPLGRSALEVQAVVDTARKADRLLGVDLSYRFTAGMQAIRDRIGEGALGAVHGVDLVFHNAYGPDKPWFYDPAQSGGGCMMDLGVHLVDLALWALDFPGVVAVDSALFAQGAPLRDRTAQVEDYGVATLRLTTGAVVRIACSWNLHAGQEAVIGAEFHGAQGGAAMRNVGGSFYDFEAHAMQGTSRTLLASGDDPWGGRAAVDWARSLASGGRFDPAAERLVDVATTLDQIYEAAMRPTSST